MSDRNSVEIYSVVFRKLAELLEDPSRVAVKAASRAIWNARVAYDFADYDLPCIDALVKLGLAREVPDPAYPGETMELFYGEDFEDD